MRYLVCFLLLIPAGCESNQREEPERTTSNKHEARKATTCPRILSKEEAEPYLRVCRSIPPEVKNGFVLSELLKNEDVYLQTIAMPSGKVLVILSSYGPAGLIVFDKNRKITQVLDWYKYMKDKFPIYALDKAYYRLEEDNGKWGLVVEYHACTSRRGGVHYLYQFHYGPYSSGSSLRYRLQKVQQTAPPARPSPKASAPR